MAGEVPTIEPELVGDFGTLMDWADELPPHERARQRRHPARRRMARQFGAEGIGLCRTEHMFFDAERISAVREMILAEDEAGRRARAGQAAARAARRLRRDLPRRWRASR